MFCCRLLPLSLPQQIPQFCWHGRRHVQHRPDRAHCHPAFPPAVGVPPAPVEAVCNEMRCNQHRPT